MRKGTREKEVCLCSCVYELYVNTLTAKGQTNNKCKIKLRRVN